MPIIHNVSIDPTEIENYFHITWHNAETRAVNSFEQTADITPEETQMMWQWPRCQLDIGQKLFRFLDGENQRFRQALNLANYQGERLQVNLRTCKQTADWPFELLAKDGTFLLPDQVHLVRSVSDWGKGRNIPPQNHPLKLLFMACSALDVDSELDFEKEEEAIFRITENLSIDMEIEDSGSLEGLRSRLEKEKYDVVHLSGHAGIDKSGHPYFFMEDETGHKHNVFPDELWNKCLIENPPRLLFLSGCRTGEVPDRPDSVEALSFAHWLVEKNNVPAVLEWRQSMRDEQAIHASKILYHELCRGKTILKAVQRVRYELMNKFESKPHPAWSLLILFSNSIPLKPIVKEGQEWKTKPRRMKHIFLKHRQVQALEEGFVGRRRELQQSLRTLKQNFDKVGLLLLGTSGLGKSCLAGKICERFPNHTLIIVHGIFNTITLVAALKFAFNAAQDETGGQLLAAKREMQETLANLCATSFKEKNYLLLLDDFDQNLEGAEKGQPGPLVPEAVELLRVLLHYLPSSGNMTQMIITCRYQFALTVQGVDLVADRLEPVWLTSFQPAEQRKKVRELRHVLNYADPSATSILMTAGHGNPRLMEWLDMLLGECPKTKVSELLEKFKDKQEEFIREYKIRESLHKEGNKLAGFLRWFSIYRRPVFEEGFELVAEKADLQGWKELLYLGRRLSLVEYNQVPQTYQVTPLLKEELVKVLEEVKPAHEAACAYHQKCCEACDDIDPILTEELIFHALGCGKEDIASEQGGRLINYLRKRLLFKESRRIGEWILIQKKQECHTKHDAFLLNELAITINELGDQPKAIRYHQQALEIWKKVYGEKHQNVGAALNNLGEAYRAWGEPRKALRFYQEALKILNNVHEKTHPQVTAVMNNLGEAFKALEDYSGAIDYYQQALDIDEKVFGRNHPKVAIRLNNLGEAYLRLKKKQPAKEYFEQAYVIFKEFLGEEHSYTKTAKKGLKDCSEK